MQWPSFRHILAPLDRAGVNKDIVDVATAAHDDVRESAPERERQLDQLRAEQAELRRRVSPLLDLMVGQEVRR